MSAPRSAGLRALAAGVVALVGAAVLGAAGCVEPASPRCDDGSYCPPDTVCGEGVCVVEPGACPLFSGRAPCLGGDETGQFNGHCGDGVCDRGVDVSALVQSVFPEENVRGASVTVREHPEIPGVVTEGNGTFTIAGVPKRSEIALALAAEGEVPGLTHVIAIGDGELRFGPGHPIVMVTNDAFAGLAAAAGTAPSDERGAVAGMVGDDNGGLRNARVGLVPGGGLGPFYVSADGVIDLGATETTTGLARFLFLDVPPGEHEVVVFHDLNTECSAFTFEAPAPVRAPVDGGHLTWVGKIICNPPVP